MNRNPIPTRKWLGAFGILCLLAAVGCERNLAEQSPSYQKLPPGEGEKRLQDTLKRRGMGKPIEHPVPADQRVGG